MTSQNKCLIYLSSNFPVQVLRSSAHRALLTMVSLLDTTMMIAAVVPLCLIIPSTTCLTLFSRCTPQVAQLQKRNQARCMHVHKQCRNDVHVVASGARLPRQLRLARTYMPIRMLYMRCGMGLHTDHELAILAV